MIELKDKPEETVAADKNELDKRLDTIGWGLFLIMIGGIWLVPAGTVPEGTWLIGTGLILLGLMGIRSMHGIKVNVFWLVVGLIALTIGIGEVFGINISIFPILLIIIGSNIVIKSISRKT